MKNLRFISIKLLSNKSKKAKVISFDPKTTIINGGNDTGKSCLIKSIYYTLGAETNHHLLWNGDNVISLLKFELDSKIYSMLRNGGNFSIFDSNDKLLGNYYSVTKDLAPFLMKLFDYKIKILNKQGKKSYLTPAYFYLPYYIDQDLSWNDNWNSFLKLGQFSGWKHPLIEYVTGIKPNQYYDYKAELDILRSQKNIKMDEYKIQEKIFDKINERKEDIINISINDFEDEINELLVEINKIKVIADSYKNKLSEKYNELNILNYQKSIVENVKKELHDDYEFAVKLPEEEIECPICGSSYHNGFQERFEIAKDEDACNDLLLEIIVKINDLTIEINGLKNEISANENKVSKLNNILNVKKENITLRELIKSESIREAKNTIKKDILENEKEQIKIDDEIKLKRHLLKEIDNPTRSNEIVSFYIECMKKYLYKLDVHTLKEDDYKNISTKVNETGSDLPRALLAYYYSIINTIFKYSDMTKFPIVIDSPNQNAQDVANLTKMYDFILEFKPEGSQLILGTEDVENFKQDGTIIELKDKYNLLQEDEYPIVHKELEYYINESFELR